MNRKKQQAELLFRLGQYFGPVMRACDLPDQYDNDEQERVMGRAFAESDQVINDIAVFMDGEPGHSYAKQAVTTKTAVYNLTSAMIDNGIGPVLRTKLEEAKELCVRQIISVPIPIDSTIHEAKTPFKTYCFVKDLCDTVGQQIVWLDRYFDQTIFHRFFADVSKKVDITLVTWPAAKAQSNADRQRVSEFRDISKLFAAERGPKGYRLVENDNFHDRWLLCDQKPFQLGGSIKDLGKPFTIAKLDSTAANLTHFDDAILNGTEIFGPNQPNHP